MANLTNIPEHGVDRAWERLCADDPALCLECGATMEDHGVDEFGVGFAHCPASCWECGEHECDCGEWLRSGACAE